MDQPVCITRWGRYEDEYDLWNQSTWNHEDHSSSTVCKVFILNLLRAIQCLITDHQSYNLIIFHAIIFARAHKNINLFPLLGELLLWHKML